ncbi:restriction endonuclease [Leptolyngbya sp. Heron Island J]|uniref:Uma2 family endonuclease n=1 Tax=Leptolyngbya sp. Heron Island J TaxID=1385935 RepID=UPI0003B9731B|nr:Uma2 family endonuclease [Leptolyngbya sp. Heron Island J]ESA32791.1 restriction endonuclease [Leptolyngbya sp. Heron Island J]
MIAVPSPQQMTVAAYLDWEPRQELRYEFVNGSVFAMTGGSLPHNDIAINLLTVLRPHIRKQGCRINMADAKVNITPQIYRYPDLAISCDERDKTALDALRYPKLIIEVLSSGTETLDRSDKFKEYRSLPSLEEYILISSTQIEVEIYRRGEGRLWLYTAYQAGDVIQLESVGFEFPIELLYEDVRLESEGTGE